MRSYHSSVLCYYSSLNELRWGGGDFTMRRRDIPLRQIQTHIQPPKLWTWASGGALMERSMKPLGPSGFGSILIPSRKKKKSDKVINVLTCLSLIFPSGSHFERRWKKAEMKITIFFLFSLQLTILKNFKSIEKLKEQLNIPFTSILN